MASKVSPKFVSSYIISHPKQVGGVSVVVAMVSLAAMIGSAVVSSDLRAYANTLTSTDDLKKLQRPMNLSTAGAVLSGVAVLFFAGVGVLAFRKRKVVPSVYCF